MATLTPMQIKILRAIAENDLGYAAFNGANSRRLGFGVWQHREGGIVIRAYGIPEWFLHSRKLIEPVDRNILGAWFRLTDTGRAAVEKAGRP